MNDFPVIGDSSSARRILGWLGGKHCESYNEMYGVELFRR